MLEKLIKEIGVVVLEDTNTQLLIHFFAKLPSPKVIPVDSTEGQSPVSWWTLSKCHLFFVYQISKDFFSGLVIALIFMSSNISNVNHSFTYLSDIHSPFS